MATGLILFCQIDRLRVTSPVTPIPLARMVDVFSLPIEPLYIEGTTLTPKIDEG